MAVVHLSLHSSTVLKLALFLLSLSLCLEPTGTPLLFYPRLVSKTSRQTIDRPLHLPSGKPPICLSPFVVGVADRSGRSSLRRKRRREVRDKMLTTKSPPPEPRNKPTHFTPFSSAPLPDRRFFSQRLACLHHIISTLLEPCTYANPSCSFFLSFASGCRSSYPESHSISTFHQSQFTTSCRLRTALDLIATLGLSSVLATAAPYSVSPFLFATLIPGFESQSVSYLDLLPIYPSS